MNLSRVRFLLKAGLFFFITNLFFVLGIQSDAVGDVSPIAENVLRRVMGSWMQSNPEVADFLSGAVPVFPQEILETPDHLTMLFSWDKTVIFQSSFVLSTSEALENLKDVEDAFQTGFGYNADTIVWASIRIGSSPALGVLRWGFPALPWYEVRQKTWVRILPAFILLFLLEMLAAWLASGPLLEGLQYLLNSTSKHTSDRQAERAAPPNHPDIQRLSANIQLLLRQSEQKQDELQRQNGELESLLGGMSEGVIVVDEHLVISRMNPAALQLFPPNARGVEGRTILEVTHSSSLLNITEEILWKAHSLEEEVLTQEGRYLQVHGSLVAGVDTQRLVILVLNDITHLRRLEEVRRDFVANVSHELKTPITNIKGYVETLLEGDVNPVTTRRFHEVINSHADRMANIIDDLLTLSRLEGHSGSTPPGIFSMNQAVSEALEVVQPKAERKKISLVADGGGEIRYMEGHQRLVVQALVNLLDNAVKYSGEDSQVQVEVSEVSLWHTISVADQGVGIPDKDLDRVFERFYRVDKGRSRDMGGTGLGLSIVKHIMLLHGGRVEVASVKGQGSTFTLFFPKVEVPAP